MIQNTIYQICSSLNKHGVEYLVIGGYAVVFHGYVRTTSDLDFWYNPTISNFHNIIRAFEEQGVDVSDLHTIVFDPKRTYLRFPVSGINAEFLPNIPGDIVFSEASSRAESLRVNDIEVKVIGFEDLLRNKVSTNRLKDQADIEELKRRRQNPGT